LGQNWSGPKSTGIVDMNYNSRPLFIYEQCNCVEKNEKKKKGKRSRPPDVAAMDG
jgi:hypothetical protein